jgi:hypothetical protein
MDDQFNIVSLVWRIVFALALVLLTFNPTGHSYYHWLMDGFPAVQPLEVVVGILLVIAWVVFVRSTLAATGALGLVLMLALFGSIVWWMASRGWLDVSNRSAMAWVVLVILGLVLGIGMSWSHIRRRLSGQAAVDRIDQN